LLDKQINYDYNKNITSCEAGSFGSSYKAATSKFDSWQEDPPVEMPGVYLYTFMKTFYEFFSLLRESNDEMFNDLVANIKNNNNEIWTYGVLADYLERIGKDEEAKEMRSLIDRVSTALEKYYSTSDRSYLSDSKWHLHLLMNMVDRMRYPDQENTPKSLKREMENLIKTSHPEADDFVIEAAIKWFACDHYNGMGDHLYSICSTSEYKPGRSINSINDEDEMVQMAYEILQNRFS